MLSPLEARPEVLDSTNDWGREQRRRVVNRFAPCRTMLGASPQPLRALFRARLRPADLVLR